MVCNITALWGLLVLVRGRVKLVRVVEGLVVRGVVVLVVRLVVGVVVRVVVREVVGGGCWSSFWDCSQGGGW